MDNQIEHYRHILLFYFRKGKNAVQARKKLSEVYGKGCLTERQCQRWFARFRSGNFNVQDAPHTGRPTTTDDHKIKALIETNRRMTTREIAEKLDISNSTVYLHLQQLGYVNKLDVWVPHELKEIHLTKRINICDSLLNRNQNDQFLKRIITGDEKWIVYDNVVRKRSWIKQNEPPQSTSKANIHQKKIMLSVWWDYKGIVYFEMLPRNQTIDSNVYCRQLSKLNEEIKKKRPELANRKGVMFHQDNARPHTSLITRQKLTELNWELMPHPPYSPDLAPSDYHLFRSLQNHLNGKTFDSDQAVKNELDQFFASKNQCFFERGIFQLTERWLKVIQQNGQYIID